ncbi:Calcium channel yvc1 [Rhodosporidiobolus nylandii]
MTGASHEAHSLLHHLEAGGGGPMSAGGAGADRDDGEGAHHHEFHPKTVQRIITRIQALTLELLPIQVDLDELTSPTSSILTKDVVEAYSVIAGDFAACLPFALLEARRYFREQQRLNPSDADENAGRKLACEAIARKIVARAEMRAQYKLLSKRFTTIDEDGDETLPLSALESAVDQHATFFLSSNEAQRCTFALWKGLLVQNVTESGNIEYQLYKVDADGSGFLAHWNPDRIGFFFRISLWIVFLTCYTFAIQTPERGFGVEDAVLFVQLLGYIVEDIVRIYKIGIFAATGFWQLVNWMIYTLGAISFVYRCLDLTTSDPEKSSMYRMRAFQWLSSAAPLIWAKLLTVFDLFRFFGVLQIVVWRMLKESAVFFVLLSILAVGFGQALTGLDVADERRDSTGPIVNYLLQALLGSPQFDYFDEGATSYPFGLVLYYSWSVATLVILLNVLVALFSTSYSECVDESEPTFLSFFAGKTIASVRAPDEYVFVAPFNLIELFILPLELVLSKEAYGRVSRWLMGILFFLPISAIALWETHIDPLRLSDLDELILEKDEYQEPEEDPEPYRPSGSAHSSSSASMDSDLEDHPGEPEGMEISKVKFKDLKKKMPDLTASTEGKTLALVLELSKEIKALRAEVAALRKGDDEQAAKRGDEVDGQQKKVEEQEKDSKAMAD